MNQIVNKIVSCLLLLFIATGANAAFILLDRIAVIVDENVIMQSEVQERIQSVKAQLSADASAAIPPDDVITEQVIERLIVETLQLRMAENAGVRVSDAELNESIQRIAAQNNLSLPDFRAAIEQDGISYPKMREQIRKEIIISEVQRGVLNNRMVISAQEIKNFLASELGETVISDDYRIAHILLPIPEEATDAEISELRTLAENLVHKANEGSSFQALAVEHSAGQNALNGGDLGWRKPIQLPTIFSDIAQQMTIDEVRGPIESGSGLHLIKLVEKRGARTRGQIAQSRVRHVLIKPNEIRTDEEALELSENLRNEVMNGRDFEEIAKLYSEDPGSALSGGDLGWNQGGIYVPEFEQMILDSQIDVVSPVFKSSHGYHFLEVTGRRIEDFSEEFQKNMAENYLRNQKFDEELQSWIQEIRDEAFVDIRI